MTFRPSREYREGYNEGLNSTPLEDAIDEFSNLAVGVLTGGLSSQSADHVAGRRDGEMDREANK